MIPVIQKHPMGNTAITNSFKPKETLRDREFSFVSKDDGVTPEDPNTNSTDKYRLEKALEDHNLIHVVD